MSISRKHAVIRYNVEANRFELIVMGKNGMIRNLALPKNSYGMVPGRDDWTGNLSVYSFKMQPHRSFCIFKISLRLCTKLVPCSGVKVGDVTVSPEDQPRELLSGRVPCMQRNQLTFSSACDS